MKILSPRRDAGFTVIELIVVLVIIGILGTLILFSYSGVRSRDRDAARQENVDTAQSHLEIFYAQKSFYPTLDQLNDSEWRTKNMPELKSDSLQDPSWATDGNCTVDGHSVLIGQPATDCYAYHPTAADGEACDNKKTPCAHYTLTAKLESGEDYIKTSLN